MRIEKTPLNGCFIIYPEILSDGRGSFMESYNEAKFTQITGIKVNFVQDNQSVSKRGVLRGLHFQQGTYAQAKLVRVVKGAVQDVVVDIRKNSETFGQSFSMVLDEATNAQLFIPKGFAHAFLALEEDTVFAYKCDEYYHKIAEQGIRYNDAQLKIQWMLPEAALVISEKDRLQPFFKDLFP